MNFVKTFRLILICFAVFCAASFSREDIKSGANNARHDEKQIRAPLIVAHRGASRFAPENTIPAFELAWKNGADAIEGDFRLTSDGRIVCVHDADTQRIAGRKLVVSDSTLQELRQLDIGRAPGGGAGLTKIPTIEEFFATVPDKEKKVFIEIKCGVEIIPKMINAVEKSGLRKEQIVIISFNREVLRQFKQKAPRYKCYWLWAIRKDRGGELKPNLETVLVCLKAMGADGFSSNKNNITKSFIDGVREKGYEYHVWTVDDVKTARRFRELGVQSITTNVPGLMKRELAGTAAN